MKGGPVVRCGCERHFIPAHSPNVVLINGKVWQARCAVVELQALLHNANDGLMKYRMRLQRLNRDIAKVACAMCGEPVGKFFKFNMSAFECSGCGYELGGEAG